MKAITLYEPWATLMAIGAKVSETRPARTKHRGDICIHAAQKPVEEISPECLAAFRNRALPMTFHYGCIVAVVELWEVRAAADFVHGDDVTLPLPPGKLYVSDEEFSCGNYAPGRWIYRTRNLRRLKEPVPASGLQCVGWTVPADVEELVRAQLGENAAEDSFCSGCKRRVPADLLKALLGGRYCQGCIEHAVANMEDTD